MSLVNNKPNNKPQHCATISYHVKTKHSALPSSRCARARWVHCPELYPNLLNPCFLFSARSGKVTVSFPRYLSPVPLAASDKWHFYVDPASNTKLHWAVVHVMFSATMYVPSSSSSLLPNPLLLLLFIVHVSAKCCFAWADKFTECGMVSSLLDFENPKKQHLIVFQDIHIKAAAKSVWIFTYR